jgi:hypothetical protein
MTNVSGSSQTVGQVGTGSADVLASFFTQEGQVLTDFDRTRLCMLAANRGVNVQRGNTFDMQALERAVASNPQLRAYLEGMVGFRLDFGDRIDGVIRRAPAMAQPVVVQPAVVRPALAQPATGTVVRVQGTPGPGGAVYVPPAQANPPPGVRVQPAYVPPRPPICARLPPVNDSRTDLIGRTRPAGNQDWSFLDDPHMSIEEKLLLFLAKIGEQTKQELDELMDRQSGRSGSGQNGARSGQGAQGANGAGGGGIMGLLGPVAQIGCTVLGGVFGGPLGAMLGGSLGGTVGDLLKGFVGLFGGGGAGGAGQAAGAAGASGTNGSNGTQPEDSATAQTRMQYLIQRRQEIATMVSNVLSNIHQTQMTSINNMRG